MSTNSKARFLVPALVENCFDLMETNRGTIDSNQVRRLIVDAVVDARRPTVCLPRRFIHELGLWKSGESIWRSATGPKPVRFFGPVRLTIQGRQCHVDAVEISDEEPAQIGHIPLTILDFVIDSNAKRLIGNPAHGGEQMLEMY